LADRDATDAELRCALNAAGAPGLALGLATALGDGGRPVSAGERQRIALARVLLRPRGLYLLDEPTAHLDPLAEAVALEALGRALAGRSALIVSHRPAVLAIADRVVALDNGSFTMVGPHALDVADPLGVGV
jgi:ABC-type transport system involved in cytochrome bd biosynthesis fused ATPase/permease subunit